MNQGLSMNGLRWVVCPAILLIVFGLSYATDMAATAGEQGTMQDAAEAKALDVSSSAEVERWTEGTCKGWTLGDLAESLGVEPTMEAVVSFLSRGFPSQAKSIVWEFCERELGQTRSS
jgi:hypothetical protein